MAIYTMLTDIGLNKIGETQGTGMYIEITRWVGAFDKQLYLDYKNDNIDYTDISNYTMTSDLYPNNQYGLPQLTEYSNLGVDGQENTVYWMGGAEDGFTIDWNSPAIDDLYSGVTYSSVGISDLVTLKGDYDVSSEVYPTNPLEGDYWTVKGTGVIDSIQYCDGDIMAYVNGVWVNGNNSTSRAHFKIPVQSSIYKETLLINKIGAYAILRDSLGIPHGGPFLLGQVIIPQPQLIQPLNTASGVVDTLFVEFQIDAQSALINFDNIVFSSENDYWQQLVHIDGSYGLEYEGNVYIAQQLAIDDLTPNIGDSVTDIGISKLFVSTFHTLNSVNPESERTLPQLNLQYVDNSENNITRRIRTTFRTTDDGDCEIDMYGACSNEFGYYSLVPKTDEIFGLGNKTNRWRWLEASHNIDLYRGDYIVGEDGKISQDGEWYYIDNSSTTTKRSWRSSSSLKANDYQDLQIYGNIADEWGFTSLRNNYMSANTNLGMAYFGNTSVFVGPHYDSRDFVNGGALKENYFYTYGNISNYIAETKDVNNNVTGAMEYPFCLRSTQDINLYTISTDNLSKYDVEHLATYGGYDALGVTMEIWNMIYYGTNQNSSNFVSKFTGIADGISTIYNSFFTEANYDLYGSKAVTIQDVRDDLFGENPNGQPTGTNVRGIGKDILLTSSRYIYTFGDIVPMVDGLNNLGSWNHNFRDLHVGTINGIKYSDVDEVYRSLTVNGNIVPLNIDHNIGSKVTPWNTVYTKYLGDKINPIDTGYISKLNVSTITAQNISTTSLTCLDINNNMSIDNLQGNINIARINGLDISLYLNENSNSTIYSFSLYLVDGIYNISRAHSGDGRDGFIDTGYLFSFTMAAEIKDENFVSLVLRFPTQNLKITKNKYGWNAGGETSLLYTDAGHFKQLLIDTYGETVVNNAEFTSKSSNGVTVVSDSSTVSDEYNTYVKFVESNLTLYWQMNIDPKNYYDDSWYANNGEIVLTLI